MDRGVTDHAAELDEKGYFPLTEIFYTQRSIKSVFHDGRPVHPKNIRSDWVLHVTKAPSGQWFTLNNRLLFAYEMENWPSMDPSDDSKFLQLFLLRPDQVKILPFSDIEVEFRQKFTTNDNGNTCYMRGCGGGTRRRDTDWITAPMVNGEAYKRFIDGKLDPFSRAWPTERIFVFLVVVMMYVVVVSLDNKIDEL